MSYYKNEPEPQGPRRSIQQRVNEAVPQFFEPTYERRDVRWHWPELLHWLVVIVLLIGLISMFNGMAQNAAPAGTDAPVPECATWLAGCGPAQPDYVIPQAEKDHLIGCAANDPNLEPDQASCPPDTLPDTQGAYDAGDF